MHRTRSGESSSDDHANPETQHGRYSVTPHNFLQYPHKLGKHTISNTHSIVSNSTHRSLLIPMAADGTSHLEHGVDRAILLCLRKRINDAVLTGQVPLVNSRARSLPRSPLLRMGQTVRSIKATRQWKMADADTANPHRGPTGSLFCHTSVRGQVSISLIREVYFAENP